MIYRLNSFIDRTNVLYKQQFGFQRNSSTSDAILQFLDSVYNSLDKGNFLISVFLDLRKAFDTVNHNILLSKIQHIGFRGQTLQWFKSYLLNRKQIVYVNGTYSGEVEVNIGVPQGSIVRPLMCLLHISDMSRCSDVPHFIHYAENTTIFSSSNSIALDREMNCALQCVSEWLRTNRLSKCKENILYDIYKLQVS